MYKIGEFSVIAQVSARLLRYYEEIGLFSPQVTDEVSGYRYYSAAQLPHLNRILAARELGFTLEQIARLVDQDLSTDELRGMLTLRKAQIEQAVQSEAERLRVVESRLRQLDDAAQGVAPDVVLKAVPAQGFFSVREVLPDLTAVRRLVQTLRRAVPAAAHGLKLGPLTLVIHAPAFEPGGLDFEVGYPVSGPVPGSVKLSGERTLEYARLPDIPLAATLVHVGPTSDTHRAYGALAGWLETHGWQVLGPGRQVMMRLPTDGPDSEAVVEVQLPVRRAAPA
ncbi:MerR family transcriptional regulator [Deinococcus irradiatisoli]|uniref:MerR family transcriptional regulator n=1 Tax=Deinococcus irradiatisoli TaxID=2202254 RepID=UPI0015E86EDD|nr:MerR family transcriptional regulator [Deinococcus irradiatisoli]